MRQLGFDEDFIEAIKSLYFQDSFFCKVGNITTSKIFPRRGLKQGCVLSPSLFNIYIMNLETRLKSLNIGINIDEKTNVSSLLFADDLLLLSETEDNMQRLFMELQSCCQECLGSQNIPYTKRY